MLCTSILFRRSSIIIIIIIIIGIQPLGRSGQRPELSQATGMALVCCILGKFLGVVLPLLSPAFRRSHFRHQVSPRRHDARDPSGARCNRGRECCPVILPKWRLPRHLGIFYMPQIYDMGPTALLPLRRKACWGFFPPLKNPTASAGFEPANLGTKGQHATPRPPKPLLSNMAKQITRHFAEEKSTFSILWIERWYRSRPVCTLVSTPTILPQFSAVDCVQFVILS